MRLELGPGVDAQIAALARRQHGVLSTAQLQAVGVAQRAVSYRVAAGRLHRLHHGVHAVGHPVLTAHGRWMAAVLAGGRGAVLSHAAAGALWELHSSAATVIAVTVRRSGRARRPGLRLHRPRTLPSHEVTVHVGIPVTTPARTILDLAATLQTRPLERLLDQAENARLTDVACLVALARARPGHRGASRLLATLSRAMPPARPAPAAGSRRASSPCAERTASRSRRSTRTSRAGCATSCSSPRGSWWRSTAGPGTEAGAPSRTIATATRPSCGPVTRRCGSPTRSSNTRHTRSRRH